MVEWGIEPHVRTRSGGSHFYLRHPGWPVATLNAKSGKASWPWPGLDIRGDGGFAVLLGHNDKGGNMMTSGNPISQHGVAAGGRPQSVQRDLLFQIAIP
jgi:hypothetical protein